VKELDRLRVELTELLGFQAKFFGTVAHDVRSPLSTVRGYAQMLREGEGDADRRRFADSILAAAEILDHFFSNLADFAAMEEGSFRIERTKTDLGRVLADVREMMAVEAGHKAIRFEVSAPARLPALEGDPARLGRALHNLCMNAVRHTPQGGSVRVDVEALEGNVTFRVEDTGPGIEPEDLPKVFDRFYQGTAGKRRRRGFGLGLPVTRAIARAHGGEVEASTSPSRGAVFTLTLPVRTS
jgi:signal transduction histidine kinase